MKSKLNVLMVVAWYTAKGEPLLKEGIFHNEQAVNLSKYCNVAIYVPFDGKIKNSLEKETEWNVLTYRTRWHEVAGRNNILLKLYRKILKVLDYTRIINGFKIINKDYKPDILHVHVAGGVGEIASLISRKYRIPMIVTEHLPVEMMNLKEGSRRYNRCKRVYEMSAFNACVSDDLTKKMNNLFDECTFKTIYNGINIPDTCEGKQYMYRKNDCINIVIVALMYDKDIKGLQFLLPALKKVIEEGKPIVLHHIGGGKYLDYYKNIASDLGIQNNCVFYGQCEKDKVNRIVDEMDFFVSSSLVESAGVSVMEAMMLGKPILATDSGGVDSLVPSFGGMIVEKGSVDSLVSGLLKMIDEYKSYDADQIRKYAKDKFLIDNINKKYMDVYSDVCKKNK